MGKANLPLEIHQSTSLRVLHRRSAAIRIRNVLSLKSYKLHNHWFRLSLSTTAGTYVNEFCHGDCGDDADLEYDEEIEESALEEFDNDFARNDSDKVEEGKASVAEVAGAIKFAQGSVANNIAVHHELEVTTPAGASDESCLNPTKVSTSL